MRSATTRAVVIVGALTAPLAAAPAGAQYFAGLSYTAGIATGETRDFVNNTSWKGFTFEARRAVRDGFAAGVVLGTNVFESDAPALVPSSQGPVTEAGLHKLFYSMALVAADWFGGDRDSPVRPFGGVGAGVYYVDQKVEAGATTTETTNWHLGFAPEAGVAVRLTPQSHATLIVRYNYPVRGGQYVDDDVHSYQFVSIAIGAAVLTF